MQPQAFLDGFRSARGMGMANTRNSLDRSSDQDQTQSGNPRTIYNAPQFRGRTPSFHQQPQQQMPVDVPPQAAGMSRFPMARTRGGAPGQVAEMAQQLPPQPMPTAPVEQRRFNAPRFNTNMRARQMWQ
jgi:hypothetical protein